MQIVQPLLLKLCGERDLATIMDPEDHATLIGSSEVGLTDAHLGLDDMHAMTVWSIPAAPHENLTRIYRRCQASSSNSSTSTWTTARTLARPCRHWGHSDHTPPPVAEEKENETIEDALPGLVFTRRGHICIWLSIWVDEGAGVPESESEWRREAEGVASYRLYARTIEQCVPKGMHAASRIGLRRQKRRRKLRAERLS